MSTSANFNSAANHVKARKLSTLENYYLRKQKWSKLLIACVDRIKKEKFAEQECSPMIAIQHRR